MTADAAPGTLLCPQCGAVSAATQRFCGNCGAKLESPKEAGAPPPPDSGGVGEGASPVAVVRAEVAVPASPSSTPPESGGGGAPVTAPLTPVEPLTGPQAQRERDRLLTLANVQRVRGQLGEARRTIDSVLALSEGLSDRERAPVHELRGDLLQAEGKWEEAQAAFEKAHTLDPERVGAEKKFAEATLRIGEAKAIASGSMLGLGGDGFGVPKRQHGAKPGVAVIASLFVPGFGQLVNGELVKAGICLGVFLLTLVALRLSPDSVVLFAKINALVAPNGPAAARALDPLSPLMYVLLALLAADWVYSLFDAAAGASKAAESGHTNAPPAGDRSGWEV